MALAARLVAIVAVVAVLPGQPVLEPGASVLAQVERLGMTDHGKGLYLASEPEILPENEFRLACPADDGTVGFGPMGCYFPAQRKIYIYDVTDPRLDGSEEVTAAHEMLHAAWWGLSEEERARLTPLLEAEVDRLEDPGFRWYMESYFESKPDRRASALHSIAGTQWAAVGDELEHYYAQYFLDRQVVLDLNSLSASVFADLRARAYALADGLAALKAQPVIDSESVSAVDAELDAIYAEIAELERGMNFFG